MSAPITPIALTEAELNVTLSALVAKLTETKSYLSHYGDVAGGPRDTDSCCQAHLAHFERRKVEREALQERLDTVDALFNRLEELEAAERGEGILLSIEQLTAWAGRELSRAELERLDEAIPESSIPEAIGVIADNLG